MTGIELTNAMRRVGITCRQLAHLCGWQCESRVVEARSRGTSDIPEIIDMALEKFIGHKRYEKLVDTLADVKWIDVEKAKTRVIVGPGIEINKTYRRQLQVVAAKYGVRVEVYGLEDGTGSGE